MDFAHSMIPHQQAAVDRAKVVPEHGMDPEIRKLTEGAIKSKEGEIAMLKAWPAAREMARSRPSGASHLELWTN